MNEGEDMHPFEGEEAAVGGNLDEIEPTEEHPKAGWVGWTDKGILIQTDRITRIVAAYLNDLGWLRQLIEVGEMEPTVNSSTFTFLIEEKIVIACALNLIGFFSEIMGNEADKILDRLLSTDSELAAEEEFSVTMASEKVSKVQMAKLLGLSLEEYEEVRKGEMERRYAEDNDPED